MAEPAKYSKHFSHEHPLEHVDSRSNQNRLCSACKLTISPNSFFYHCNQCQFSLHKVCFAMPKKVLHPADPGHYLHLLPSSITEQSSDCKACGRHINGFYYNCSKCCLNYHMLCVAMPLSVKIPSSHPHILKLELQPPYDFQCDLCDKPSYSGWLYRCRQCEFDAHVSCAVKGSVSRICSSDRTKDSQSHHHEMMDLLSQVMKGIEVKNVNNFDQSIPVSEDINLPSYQFSDACFSIDISKSILIEKARNQEFVFGKKELKRELSLAPHVWKELDHENTNEIVNATKDRIQLKDQTTAVGNVNLKRPFWSKLLTCF